MAEEEHNSRCSNSRGGGGGDSHRSSKKLKIKKLPQRGMGVAQLEKIISEQRQKKDAPVFTHNSIISPTNSSSNFRPPQPPPLPHNHHPWISKTDGCGGCGGNWCRLLSDGVYSFQGEKQTQDQNQYQNQNLGGLRYESNPPFWTPFPNLMLQRSQHLQQHCSSSMIEPPSNQSYYGNNYHHLQPQEEKVMLRPQEEKMVGMKRPCPFLLESGPIPSFQCKFPAAYESASCRNGGTTSINPAHPSFRENQVVTRDFLKLAPHQESESDSSSKEKLYLSPCIGDQSQFEILPPQKDQSEDPSHLSGRGGSNLPPFLGLFPAASRGAQTG